MDLTCLKYNKYELKAKLKFKNIRNTSFQFLLLDSTGIKSLLPNCYNSV